MKCMVCNYSREEIKYDWVETPIYFKSGPRKGQVKCIDRDLVCTNQEETDKQKFSTVLEVNGYTLFACPVCLTVSAR